MVDAILGMLLGVLLGWSMMEMTLLMTSSQATPLCSQFPFSRSSGFTVTLITWSTLGIIVHSVTINHGILDAHIIWKTMALESKASSPRILPTNALSRFRSQSVSMSTENHPCSYRWSRQCEIVEAASALNESQQPHVGIAVRASIASVSALLSHNLLAVLWSCCDANDLLDLIHHVVSK